jgi:hypothetical protein
MGRSGAMLGFKLAQALSRTRCVGMWLSPFGRALPQSASRSRVAARTRCAFLSAHPNRVGGQSAL